MKANVLTQMQGLITFLEENLPTYIDEVEAEVAIDILPPAEWILGYRENFNSNHYPAGFVVAAYGNPDPSGQGAQTLPLAADIVIAYCDSDPQRLEEAILGYADALINLFGENESLGELCDLAEITYLDWYHGGPGSKDIAVVMVSIIMRSEIRT